MGGARTRVAGLVALTALIAGGCASEISGPGEGVTSAIATTPAQGATVAPTPDRPRFDPFRDGSSEDSGRREVIESPTLAQVLETGPLGERSIGRADAPVVLIKYMSLTCPYCRRFQLESFPILKREYIDTGKVRFVLREFPIGHQSGLATIALRCARPEAYFQLYEKFLSKQAAWVSQEVRPDPIFKVASEVGMTRAEFDSCRQNQAMINGLKWVKDRGRSLGIIGTPNFYVNERLVKKVVGIAELREMIDPLVQGQGRTAATTRGTPR